MRDALPRFLIASALLLLSYTAAFAGSFRFTGAAHDLDSGELLYREEHLIELNGKGDYSRGEVSYVDGRGQLIAVKALVFEGQELAPEVSYRDLRDGSSFTLAKEQQAMELNQLNKGVLSLSRIELPLDELVVIDAGFDRMVQKYWHDLEQGAALDFEFFAPTRGKFVSFEIQRIKINETQVQFKVRPQNWLFNLLVEPLFLVYERSSRRLQEYRGLTNIAMYERGKVLDGYYRARISYFYPERSEENTVDDDGADTMGTENKEEAP